MTTSDKPAAGPSESVAAVQDDRQEGKGAPTREASEPPGTPLGPALDDLGEAGKILHPSIESDLDDLGLARLCVYDLADEARILLERESAPEHLRIGFHEGAWKAWDAEYPEHGTVELRPRHRAISLVDLASQQPTAGPPAAPVLEGKDPGEPQSPSVSAEERVLTGQSFQCPRAPADAGGHHRWIKAIAPGYDPITATTCGFCGVLLSEASAIDVLASLAEAERKESAAYARGRAEGLERAARIAGRYALALGGSTDPVYAGQRGAAYRLESVFQDEARALAGAPGKP